ncbi:MULTISPECIES: P1 family peptidase [unclassified Streptomyces]|uniref:P1 family peptidase n=1 Tax=unclassified Streptomyces TaxID=2593676 RepID=UPI002E0FDD40|nr:P1 family peptidase [Streptomyces sp. NBC_01197]WSS49757.1 P1 family peptidase [Streptomyces sp. NBC_01180]
MTAADRQSERRVDTARTAGSHTTPARPSPGIGSDSDPDQSPPDSGSDSLTDVDGLRVGHARVPGERALSGTTVVLAPPGGAVAAVDVRGGGPGTRETDALDPRNLVQRVDAVVLTGGSAYGLDSAAGVMAWLEEQGRGFQVGPDPAQVVPVVPAACVFDLGRGGDWRARPDASTGRAAVEAAADTAPGTPVEQGSVGAGTGAVAGGLKGGVGSASITLASGVTVGALAVVNAVGSPVDPLTGVLYGEYGLGRPEYPSAAVHEAAQRQLALARERNARPPLNTTIAVVATDAELTRAQAQKLAGTAHDGLARAVRPVHLLHDGDTVFALATGTGHRPDLSVLNEVLAAGADALSRAVVRAVRAAESVEGPGGWFPAHRDLYGAGAETDRT